MFTFAVIEVGAESVLITADSLSHEDVLNACAEYLDLPVDDLRAEGCGDNFKVFHGGELLLECLEESDDDEEG